MDNDKFGFSYVKSKEGIFKILEITCSIISYICILVHTSTWVSIYIGFFNTATFFAFFYVLIMLLFSMCTCVSNLNSYTWRKVDCVVCIFISNLLFISSTLVTTISSYAAPELTSAAVFGYMNGILFLFNSILKIMS